MVTNFAQTINIHIGKRHYEVFISLYGSTALVIFNYQTHQIPQYVNDSTTPFPILHKKNHNNLTKKQGNYSKNVLEYVFAQNKREGGITFRYDIQTILTDT